MTRALTTSLLLALTLALAAPAGVRAQAPAAVPATPDSAAVFLGDWSLAGSGANGPATFALTVTVDAGKVVAAIGGDAMAKQLVTDVSQVGPALLVRFSFDYQGTAIPVSLTLTPADGKIGMLMDFADGAYQLYGGATKKESPPVSTST